MTELTVLIAHFGIPVVVTAAAVYVLLRSDIRFIYPRKKSSAFPISKVERR